MKIGKFYIFPKKVKVTVGLKCGKTFYFYCDQFSWSETGGFSFDGSPKISGTKRPSFEISFQAENLSWVEQKTVRLFHIY